MQVELILRWYAPIWMQRVRSSSSTNSAPILSLKHGSFCTMKVGKKEDRLPEKLYGGGHYDGFRGDSRWVGLQSSPLASDEALLGYTELGSFYLLERPHVLAS